MARHRQEERPRASRPPAPTVSSPRRAAGTTALPSQERSERHPSGPLPRLDATRVDTPRPDAGRHDAPRHDAPRHGAAHLEASRPPATPSAPRHDAPRHETPRPVAPRLDPRSDGARHSAPRTDAPRTDAPRARAPRADVPRLDAPRATGGRHRSSDPETTPLDLAAIAVAAASARTTALPASTASATPATSATPSALATPATGPATGAASLVASGPKLASAPASQPASHRAVTRRPRVLLPTRAAGALALVGAIAGAGVAAAGGGTMLTAGDAPDSGELRLPAGDPALAGLAAPARTPDHRATPGTTAPAPSTTPHSTTPHPPATATATPAPARNDGGRTLWSADFGSAGLGNFKSTPWNNDGASAPKVGGGAANFTMPGGGQRSEIEPDFNQFSEGDEYYIGFSVRLADDFPVSTSDWQVISQFKNEGTGSPPLEVKVQDGQFVIDGGGGAFHQTIGRAVPGQWTHLVLKVKFSSSNGRVSAWQDGRQTITDYAPPGGTLYDGLSSYLKIGIYRDTSIGSAGRLSFGSYAIGTSLGSVDRDDRASTSSAPRTTARD